MQDGYFFAPGTRLDTSRSMGFKNLDLYCVAPIVPGDSSTNSSSSSSGGSGVTLESYDFWAVGLNCCHNTADFRCGEFNNPNARAGLRLMRDDQRPFFRLAVQQAAAAHGLKANHPLFFHWTADPLGEMNGYRDAGFTYFLLGIFSHFAFNLFLTTAAVLGFSRIGKV